MNASLNATIAQQVVDAVNQWVESRTHRCFGEIRTVTERRDWEPEIWLHHMDVNTNQGPNVVAMGVPNVATPTAADTGGTLPANLYYYVVTALSNYAQTTDEQTGETAGSTEVSIRTGGSTSVVTLDWASLPDAAGYNIYRSTESGGETLLASVGNVTSFQDTGADTPGMQTPPPVSGGMTITLGYPHLLQSTLDNTSFFWNEYGRVTMYLQAPLEFNPSAVNNDLVQITYSYGYTTLGYNSDGTPTVPDDLNEAALGIAAGFYNWVTNGQRDIVAASVGQFRLQFAGSIRGTPGVTGDLALNPSQNVGDVHWMTVESYKMQRL